MFRSGDSGPCIAAAGTGGTPIGRAPAAGPLADAATSAGDALAMDLDCTRPWPGAGVPPTDATAAAEPGIRPAAAARAGDPTAAAWARTRDADADAASLSRAETDTETGDGAKGLEDVTDATPMPSRDASTDAAT